MAKPIKHLKVIYEPNNEAVDTVVSNALLTSFMSCVTRIGLRVDQHGEDMVIIDKENGSGKKKE